MPRAVLEGMVPLTGLEPATPALRRAFRPTKEMPIEGGNRKRLEILATEAGAAGLHAKYRFIQHISYFFAADPDWTREALIPLLSGGPNSAPMWKAFVQQMPSRDVLRAVSSEALLAAQSDWIDDRAGERLSEILVASALRAAVYGFHSAAPAHELQQMLRRASEAARVGCARTRLWNSKRTRFVRENTRRRAPSCSGRLFGRFFGTFGHRTFRSGLHAHLRN